jgi:hypothetical protein
MFPISDLSRSYAIGILGNLTGWPGQPVVRVERRREASVSDAGNASCGCSKASAAIPAALIKRTARFVTSSPAAGAVPVAVTALAEGVIPMIWHARLKPMVAIAAALILATAGVAVQGGQKPAPEEAREQAKTAPPPAADAGAAALDVPDLAANRDIARKQLVLIDEALAMLHVMAQNGRVSIADPWFSIWGRRKLETLRKTGAGKAEIVAELEKYINALKQEEAFAEERHRAARGTLVVVRDIQYRRMEAEIWLNEEKAR